MAGCGCKKNNQTTNQISNNVMVTENQTKNDTQEINIIDQQQIERLVKKIEQINDSSEKIEE
jgi:predicted TIM-barrel enzyme